MSFLICKSVKMVLKAFYKNTFPILFFAQLFGVCGSVSEAKYFPKWNSLKKWSLIIYSLVLMLNYTANLNGIGNPFEKKFVLEFEKIVFWISLLDLLVVIPAHLLCFEDIKKVIVNIVSKSEIDLNDVNYRMEKIIVVVELLIFSFDTVLSVIIVRNDLDYFARYDTNIWLFLRDHFLHNYINQVSILTLVKYELIVKILVQALKKFNERLRNLELYIRNSVKDSVFESEIASLKMQLLNIKEHAQEISKLFGLTVLITLSFGVICTSFLGFTLLKAIIQDSHGKVHLIFLVQIIFNVVSTGLFTDACTSVVDQYNRGSIILRRLSFLCNDEERKIQQIRFLSVQHRLSDIKIDVCSYLTVTNKTLLQFVTGIAVHLIIIVQMIPKNLDEEI